MSPKVINIGKVVNIDIQSSPGGGHWYATVSKNKKNNEEEIKFFQRAGTPNRLEKILQRIEDFFSGVKSGTEVASEYFDELCIPLNPMRYTPTTRHQVTESDLDLLLTKSNRVGDDFRAHINPAADPLNKLLEEKNTLVHIRLDGKTVKPLTPRLEGANEITEFIEEVLTKLEAAPDGEQKFRPTKVIQAITIGAESYQTPSLQSYSLAKLRETKACLDALCKQITKGKPSNMIKKLATDFSDCINKVHTVRRQEFVDSVLEGIDAIQPGMPPLDENTSKQFRSHLKKIFDVSEQPTILKTTLRTYEHEKYIEAGNWLFDQLGSDTSYLSRLPASLRDDLTAREDIWRKELGLGRV